MPDDYVPRPSRSNTGWIVAIVLLVALVPLLLCGLGVLGLGWFYTRVEVQQPQIIEVNEADAPDKVQQPEEPAVEPESD